MREQPIAQVTTGIEIDLEYHVLPVLHLAKASPLVAEFVQIVARLVQHLPEPQRSNKLRAVIAALDDPAPSRPERVLNVLFPQGGEA